MDEVWMPVRAACAQALALAFPVECAGCGQPDIALCDTCRGMLHPQVVKQVLADGLTVRSALPFAGVPARVLRALKEEGRTSLARAFAPALAAALGEVPGVVVPVPTSRAAMRRRGYRVAELLARRAGVRPVRALRIVRATADQRGLSRTARADNVTGSLQATRRLDGLEVIVVDDVVTTGATLVEAARALRTAGAHVRAAVTVAATPRHFPDTAG
ncbi:phosphoribosyltransferase family protein [Microbacterium horticulturae]|uniref:Phosphoribosyltransferase family protein n=1 Tax=Microbacterium horticulturae TaxID=3028316 RepID=A0ABY8BUL8_9MICO|nr:phosphoribosyltransferase family protein [Microbacterium sp. KACC 23027]WEG07866.1 phosphoribosyltransferase family protein [Microbacterium sp. KACC 23027]